MIIPGAMQLAMAAAAAAATAAALYIYRSIRRDADLARRKKEATDEIYESINEMRLATLSGDADRVRRARRRMQDASVQAADCRAGR